MIIPKAGFPKNYHESIIAFMTEFEQGVQRTFARATGAEYSECVEFFDAFADGLKKPPAMVERTNTNLLFVLMVCWRSVNMQPSVRALHGVLCQVMGSQVVGDLKRFGKKSVSGSD